MLAANLQCLEPFKVKTGKRRIGCPRHIRLHSKVHVQCQRVLQKITEHLRYTKFATERLQSPVAWHECFIIFGILLSLKHSWKQRVKGMKIASIRKRRADAYQSPMRKHQSLGLTSVETTRHGHVIKVPKLHVDIPILGFVRAQKGVGWVIWTVHLEIHRLELWEIKISIPCHRRNTNSSTNVKVGTGARTDVEQIKEFTLVRWQVHQRFLNEGGRIHQRSRWNVLSLDEWLRYGVVHNRVVICIWVGHVVCNQLLLSVHLGHWDLIWEVELGLVATNPECRSIISSCGFFRSVVSTEPDTNTFARISDFSCPFTPWALADTPELVLSLPPIGAINTNCNCV